MLRVYNEAVFAEPPKCVFFDLDNTLYPYESAHAKAMDAVIKKTIRELGVNAGQVEDAFAESRKRIKERLGTTAAAHSRLLYFADGIEIMGFHSQPLLALDLEQRYWQTFLNNVTLHQGVKEFLAALHGSGIVLCMVTDLTAQIQFRKILFLELDVYFDFIVTSEESGSDKPAPASFFQAQDKTGIDLKHTWMIGDNYDADIIGGKGVGLTTLLFGNNKKFDDYPDMIFTNYPILHEYMKKKKHLLF